MGELMPELWRKKSFILKSLLLVGLFWLIMFGLQYYVYNAAIPTETLRMDFSLVRSFAFSGAILIALSLAIGPLAVLAPKFNFVSYRRAIGVGGFVLIFFHFFNVMRAYFDFDYGKIFGDLNPFSNPWLFGFMAYPILFLLFLTSTEWATRKLGSKNWKNLHRLIYFGFLFAILHYSLILTSPSKSAVLHSIPGYLLVFATISTALLQVAAFTKRIRMGASKPLALYAGISIILLYLLLLSLAFLFPNLVT